MDRVAPGPRVRRALRAEPLERGPVRVLALGKAALPMIQAALEELRSQGRSIVEALAVAPGDPGTGTPGGRGRPAQPEEQQGRTAALSVRIGAHPVPDARSEQAGRALLDSARRGTPDEVLLVLLSGGASSLASTPAPGLSLGELAQATALLLRAGAPIELLNAFRRHTTLVSGGRLARVSPARALRVLAVSDVAGDDPSVLGSGPCAGDRSRFADALEGIDALGLRSALPAAVRDHLEAGARGQREESLAPDDPCLARVSTRVVANLADAMAGAADAARQHGFAVECAQQELSGEARQVGAELVAGLRREVRPEPWIWIGGGETTVTVHGSGRGGRSQELALAAAIALDGVGGMAMLAAGTDGIDGPTDAAGAHADGGSVARGRAQGRDAAGDLADNDAYGFFRAEGGLFLPGPTGTNVRDLVLVHLDS